MRKRFTTATPNASYSDNKKHFKGMTLGSNDHT